MCNAQNLKKGIKKPPFVFFLTHWVMHEKEIHLYIKLSSVENMRVPPKTEENVSLIKSKDIIQTPSLSFILRTFPFFHFSEGGRERERKRNWQTNKAKERKKDRRRYGGENSTAWVLSDSKSELLCSVMALWECLFTPMCACVRGAVCVSVWELPGEWVWAAERLTCAPSPSPSSTVAEFLKTVAAWAFSLLLHFLFLLLLVPSFLFLSLFYFNILSPLFTSFCLAVCAASPL